MHIAAKGKPALSFVMAALLAFSLMPMSPLNAAAYAADDEAGAVDLPQENIAQASSGLEANEAGAIQAAQGVGEQPATQVEQDSSAAAVAAESPDAVETASDEALGAAVDSADNKDGETSNGETPDNKTSDEKDEGASDSSKALDPAKLADGTYTVAVSLRNASNLAQSSMASSAIDATDKLSVQDGAYTLGLALSAVQVGSITGYVKQVDAFSALTVQDGKLQSTGEATPVWTAKSQGDTGPAAFPLAESTKVDGYAAIQLYSDEMPVSPQKAGLFIDWTTLQKVSDEPTSFDGDASGAETNTEPSTEPTPAQQQTEPAATTQEAFQVGHVYSVPIYFTKVGTVETSMAAQYFGGTAYVRPQSNGTFDVRFSTNRADYVESVSYNGAVASVTASSGSSREFCIAIPRTTSDTVATLSFVITPMKELGAGSVSADMHLYLSRASDMGADTGQVTSSTGGGGSLPSTGDPLSSATLPLMIAAFTSAGLALAARRKAFAQVVVKASAK